MKRIISATEPFTFSACQRFASKLCESYEAVRRRTIGHSILGREIEALSVENGRKRVLLVGVHHGAEWITGLCALSFMEDFLRAMGKGNAPQVSLTVIPLLNPDGVEVQQKGAPGGDLFADRLRRQNPEGDFDVWQANVRGVDLNHNYNANWHQGKKLEKECGIEGGCRSRYSGEFPESEPETAALCAFTRAYGPDCVIALHSQGEEIYCDFDGYMPEGTEEIAQAMAGAGGYKVVKLTGYTSCGGYKDWFISEFDRPGFTLEVGMGENPLPLSDFGALYPPLRKMLFAGLLKILG